MIEGRIVRIIDERTLIANVGSVAGVSVGDEFVVIQSMDQVVDPETNEELGTWEMIKARLIAIHVQSRLTTLVPLPGEVSRQTVLSERLAWGSHGAPIGSQDVSLAVDRSQVSGRRRVDLIRVGDHIQSVDE
ncbi:MAG TPA: hypothetical protein ENN56_00265 [Firmicutes bacterium]|nr:hypothetical protein [Bacillota bacterium]